MGSAKEKNKNQQHRHQLNQHQNINQHHGGLLINYKNKIKII